jgi:hypothetical protein
MSVDLSLSTASHKMSARELRILRVLILRLLIGAPDYTHTHTHTYLVYSYIYTYT